MNALKADTILAAKVLARNEGGRRCKELQPIVRSVCEQFIGKKIYLKSGGLVKAFRDALPDFPSDEVAHFYCDFTSDYRFSIQARFDAFYPAKHGSYLVQWSTAIALCEVDDGFATRMFEPQDWRTNYTVLEIQRIRKDVEHARNVLNRHLAELGDFGEMD